MNALKVHDVYGTLSHPLPYSSSRAFSPAVKNAHIIVARSSPDMAIFLRLRFWAIHFVKGYAVLVTIFII